MTYPDELLRGISTNDWLDELGYPAASLFSFSNPSSQRSDGFREESISWLDCEEALTILLNQKHEKKGLIEIQFKSGIAILPRHEIDLLKKMPWVKDYLSYERQPKYPENVYHGNLLLKDDVPKKIRVKILAHLSVCASLKPVIPNTNCR